MPTRTKPLPDILQYQEAEKVKFWELHPTLLNEMKESWRAAGKPFPTSVQERTFLEYFYGGENGYYGSAWPGISVGERIYFPELSYRSLLKFLAEKHNIVVQSIRDDAISTKKYEEWLKNNDPFSFITDIFKNLLWGVGILFSIYIFSNNNPKGKK